MKTLPLLATASLLLCGCGDEDALQAENTKLKGELAQARREASMAKASESNARKRIVELEAHLESEESRGDQLAAKLAFSSAETQLEQTRQKLEESRAALLGHSERASANRLIPRSLPAAQVPTLPAEPVKADPLASLPADAVRIIRQQASTDWPNNARMQESRIEDEADAWQKMDSYIRQSYGTLPYKEKSEIVASAQREWPMNYGMQVSHFEEQAAAWQTIETWERQGIPGVSFAERKGILTTARERWGKNYKMVLYAAEQEIGKLK